MKYKPLFIILIVLLSISFLSAAEEVKINSFILTDPSSFHDVVTKINSNGGQATFKFGKEIIWAYIPSDKIDKFNGNVKLFSGLIENSTIENLNLTDTQKSIFNAWNLRFVKSSGSLTAKSMNIQKANLNDIKFGREGVFAKPNNLNKKFMVANAFTNSLTNDNKYLIGDVVVGLVFVQNTATNGQIDWPWANYDWDSNEYSIVINNVVNGLSWLGQQNPNSHVTWTIEYTEDALVNIEPTDGGYICEGGWVDQALSNMSYSNYDDYTNHLRNDYNARWSFAMFMVIGHNTFSDSYFSYECGFNSDYGRVVSTYEAGEWGHDNLNSVLAHETAHVFGANDKYCQPGYSCCTCSAITGYLNVQNSNCEAGCFPGYEDSCGTCTQVSSLMRNQTWVIDSVTAEQLGWRDSDNDGILDPVDQYPYDYDNDGISDSTDNCKSVYNPDQKDMNHDGLGDACDSDIDGDGILNQNDACPIVWGIIQYNGCPDTFPPDISILAPLNGTYLNFNNISISVSAGENAKWIKESIDGGIQETICGDCYNYSHNKLLAEGIHNLFVSASDIFDNIGNKSVQFIVDSISPIINSVKDNSQLNSKNQRIIVGNKLNFDVNYSEANTEEVNGFCAYNVSDSSTYQSIIDSNAKSGNNSFWNWTLDLSERPDNLTVSYCQICIDDKAGNNYCWADLGDYLIDKCLPNMIQTNSSCSPMDTFNSGYSDLNNCYSQTGTDSDKMPKNQTISCDFCTPNWTNSSICNSDDSLTQWYNDTNSCFSKTGLDSDLLDRLENKSYQSLCDYNRDGIIGTLNMMNTTIFNLSLTKENNLTKFKENNKTILEFNQIQNVINLANLSIEKQSNNTNLAYLLVRGIDLTPQNQTKTIYIDRILNGTGLCIKDAEISSISEITNSCTGANETWISCPGSNNQYSCELVNNNTQYKVSGLKHSGVKEQQNFCGDGICNGAETCSLCSGDCGSCPVAPSDSGSGGGGGGGSSTSQTTNVITNKNVTQILLSEKYNQSTKLNSNNISSNKVTGGLIGIVFDNVKKTPVIIFIIFIFGAIFLYKIKKKSKKKEQSDSKVSVKIEKIDKDITS